MSLVRSRETGPEIAVRRLLHRAGYRFRLHSKALPGSPDIVLPRFKTAVFVHGCFWHGHAHCKRAALPNTRRDFWRKKIAKNRARDRRVSIAMAALGYNVVVVWQCELKDQSVVLKKITSVLKRRTS